MGDGDAHLKRRAGRRGTQGAVAGTCLVEVQAEVSGTSQPDPSRVDRGQLEKALGKLDQDLADLYQEAVQFLERDEEIVPVDQALGGRADILTASSRMQPADVGSAGRHQVLGERRDRSAGRLGPRRLVLSW